MLLRYIWICLFGVLWVPGYAELDLASYFADIDDDFTGTIHFAYGYSVSNNGEQTDDVFGTAPYALWNRTGGEVVANTKVSDTLYFRGDLAGVLLTEVNDPYMRALTYGVHMASSNWGIISLGRLPGASISIMHTTQLESGVRSYFFEDAAASNVIRKGDNTVVGTVKDFVSFGPIGGIGYRPMVRYVLPYTYFELSVAHALDYGDVTELGAKYVYDGSFARWVMLLAYANDMPGVCVNPLGGNAGFSSTCPVYQGYRYLETAGKLSLGYVDWVYNYAWLLAKQDQPTLKQWFSGLDYTFLDISEYGPLTVGIGMMQRKLGAFSYQNNTVAATADNGRVTGYALGVNKRFGRAGIRGYYERFNVFGDDTSGAAVAFDNKPVYAAGIVLYYDFARQMSED